jgi:Peptidase C13 family
MEMPGIRLRGWLAFRNLAAAAVVLVAACAAPPDSSSGPEFQSRQAQLFAATLRNVTAESAQQRRIFFIGLAMYSEDWSENDVVDFGRQFARVVPSFTVVPLIFSDSVTRQPDKYPTFSLERLAVVAGTIARYSHADDLVVVYASTHGASGVLAQKLETHSPSPVTGSQLAQALAPLADRKTIILLSACFSGSLIPNLRAPNRLIFTAARADRSSFGCQADADHTLFGKAVLDAFARPGQSLEAIFSEVQNDVTRLERERHYAPASEPQVFVGSEMASFYRQPIF